MYVKIFVKKGFANACVPPRCAKPKFKYSRKVLSRFHEIHESFLSQTFLVIIWYHAVLTEFKGEVSSELYRT